MFYPNNRVCSRDFRIPNRFGSDTYDCTTYRWFENVVKFEIFPKVFFESFVKNKEFIYGVMEFKAAGVPT